MKRIRTLVVVIMAMLCICLMNVVTVSASSVVTERTEYQSQDLFDTSTNLENTDEFLNLLQYIDGLTYQVGSRGLGVMELQNMMINLGYLPSDGADGSYGNQTAAAVMDFQTVAGLNVTGIADLTTQFMLLMFNASFLQQRTMYIARFNNYAAIIWPGEALYIGVLDHTGDFIEGTYYFTSGDYYTGEFRENVRSGQGTAHFANGDIYIGAWENDAMNGQGTYYYGGLGSTEYYEGNMTNNAMDGEGIYYLDGQVIAGTWSDNQYIR